MITTPSMPAVLASAGYAGATCLIFVGGWMAPPTRTGPDGFRVLPDPGGAGDGGLVRGAGGVADREVCRPGRPGDVAGADVGGGVGVDAWGGVASEDTLSGVGVTGGAGTGSGMPSVGTGSSGAGGTDDEAGGGSSCPPNGTSPHRMAAYPPANAIPSASSTPAVMIAGEIAPARFSAGRDAEAPSAARGSGVAGGSDGIVVTAARGTVDSPGAGSSDRISGTPVELVVRVPHCWQNSSSISSDAWHDAQHRGSRLAAVAGLAGGSRDPHDVHHSSSSVLAVPHRVQTLMVRPQSQPGAFSRSNDAGSMPAARVRYDGDT